MSTLKKRYQAASIESLEPRQMLHGGPELVYDFNTEPSSYYANNPGSDHAWLNGQMLFAASEGGDVELWRTDGTTEGTARVKDINPGSLGSQPRSFIAGDSQVFFVANSNELWVTDGTGEGTRQVITGDVFWQSLDTWTVANDKLFFEDEGTLWTSDGTVEGTVAVKQIAELGGLGFRDMMAANGKVYFVQNRVIWESDGTEAGTRTLTTWVQDLKGLAGDWLVYTAYPPSTSFYNTVTDETIQHSRQTSDYLKEWENNHWVGLNEHFLLVQTAEDTSGGSIWNVDPAGESILLAEFEGYLYSTDVRDGNAYVFTSSEAWQTSGTIEATFPMAISTMTTLLILRTS